MPLSPRPAGEPPSPGFQAGDPRMAEARVAGPASAASTSAGLAPTDAVPFRAPREATRAQRVALLAGLAGLAYLALQLFASILLPFVAAAGIAYFLDPLASRVTRAGMRRGARGAAADRGAGHRRAAVRAAAVPADHVADRLLIGRRAGLRQRVRSLGRPR